MCEEEKERIEIIKEKLNRPNEIGFSDYKIDTRVLILIIKKQEQIIEELQKDKKALVKNYDKVLGTFVSKDKIKFYYKKICASVNHFQNKNDNNIVLRIKEYLEELLEE